MDQRHEVRDRLHVFHSKLAVPVEQRIVPSFLDFGVQRADAFPFLAEFFQQRSQPWKKALRFRQCENTLFVHKNLITLSLWEVARCASLTGIRLKKRRGCTVSLYLDNSP